MLAAACVLGLLAGVGPLHAQPGGDLPEQLRVIADVRFKGNKHLGKRQLKEAHLKTRDPSSLPWHERPTLRMDYLRADTAAITALYRHYGYLDASARWVIESTPDPEAARVVFVVEEGGRAKISTVKLAGVQPRVETMISMTGVHKLIDLHREETAALQAFGPAGGSKKKGKADA